VADIDPAHRLLRIRLEVTKNRRERVVPYSLATSELFSRYLQMRRELSRERGPLFLSESCRNYGKPILDLDLVQDNRSRGRAVQSSPASPAHTASSVSDRSGARELGIHEIATFAGHRVSKQPPFTFT